MIIKSITDEHWMTYITYTQRPMHMLERRFNYIFHKFPYLIRAIDSKNIYSHIELYEHHL